MKTNKQPRVNGKFAKQLQAPTKATESNEELILQVQKEIYEGYQDIERIKKAYKLITGIDNANILLMRRTILTYVQST